MKRRIQHPVVEYLRFFCNKLLVRCLTVQNTSLGKKTFTGVHTFLSRRPTFRLHNFTCAPDRSRKRWVVKTKVFVQSRHNQKHFFLFYITYTGLGAFILTLLSSKIFAMRLLSFKCLLMSFVG